MFEYSAVTRRIDNDNGSFVNCPCHTDILSETGNTPTLTN